MVSVLESIEERISDAIRDIPDFPKKGIMFKDISPILENPILSKDIVAEFKDRVQSLKLDAIIGIESRGFIFGMPLAIALEIPFILVRKKGKLPYETVGVSYDLEYGTAEIEMHVDAIKPNWNVLIHDDLLATGGTANAAAELVQMQNANVAGFSFLVELAFLNGEKNIKHHSENIINLVSYA